MDIGDNVNTDIDFIKEIKEFIKSKFKAVGLSILKKPDEYGKYWFNQTQIDNTFYLVILKDLSLGYISCHLKGDLRL